MKTIRENIANIFTLGNLFFGCAAIIQVFNGRLDSLKIAGLYIMLAAIIDFFDGFVARILKVESEMGKQLDSLADVVSFGVAPGLILFQIINYILLYSNHSEDWYRYLVYVSFLIPLAAAYRLAKFNVSNDQKYNFSGVPTPAIGATIASFAWALYYNPNRLLSGYLLDGRYLLGLTVILAFLMVSNIKIMSFKFKSYRIEDNIDKLFFVFGALVFIALQKQAAGIFVFLWYLLVSVYNNYLSKSRNNYL
jgi:CDP-diacylglycerol---serine O-phosphatidyltransferase